MLDASGLLPVLHPPRPHWLTMLGYWFLLSLLPRLFTRPPGPKAGEKRGLNKSLACALCCGLVLLLSPTVWRLHDNTRDVLRLRLLDVGHGQAVLLEWQGGRRLLLDGGGGSFSSGFDLGREVIAATLADNRLPRLDYMLASHLDADHAQGLLFPLRHLRVDYYADNGQAPDRAFSRELVRLLDESGLPRNRLQAGDVLRLSRDLRLEFLHPAPGQTYKGKNNDASLVARLVWRGHGLALLCGDVEKSGQRSMLRPGRAAAAKDEPAPKEFAAYTLILPHHGSAGALLPDLYQAAAPRLALASAARHSPWNLPAPKVKNALRELGIPLLSTARCGQITLEWSDPQNPPRVHAARLGYLEQ
jgi:competence protein ComEC